MTSIYDTLYVICAAVGVAMAAVLLLYLSTRRPLDRQILLFCFISALMGTFIGAHLMFFIVGIPAFTQRYSLLIHDVASFLDVFFNASSGMVFYGGLYGAIAGILLLLKSRRIYARPYLNAAACGFPLMHAFGRIGCSIDGCCYGVEYHGPFAIQYTAAHINPGVSDSLADFTRFPVQLLESLMEFAICFLLVKIYLKTKDRYSVLAIYLFIYGVVRFCDEFLRGDVVRGLWGPFSTSQWIALASIIGTLIYFFTQLRSRRARSEA